MLSEAKHLGQASRWRSTGELISFTLLLNSAGCYPSYGVRLTVVPIVIGVEASASAKGTLTDIDIAESKAIATDVAAEFNMKPNPALIGFHAPDDPWEVLALYVPTEGSPGSPRDKEGITLWLSLRDDRTAVEYLIRNLRSGSETKFAQILRQSLERKLDDTFGGDRVTVREHTDLMVLAP